MNDDAELHRSRIARRLGWLQESGVALPADLATIARTSTEEQRTREAATDVLPSLAERVRSSDDPGEVAELLTRDRGVRPDAWSVFSVGDHVTGWLEKHPDQAAALFQALVERGGLGEGLASRVVAWLSDRTYYSEMLSCLSMLVSSGKQDLDEYLVSSVARALRVLAERMSEVDEGDDFWPLWSFVVGVAAGSSKLVQPHDDDPLTDSLNAPGGYLAEAFIFRTDQERQREISDGNLRGRLDSLSIGDRDFHFLARTMLASRLPWLHAVDREWAKETLIARMSWVGVKPTSEARALWQGYLWVPRLNPTLLEDLKPAFLQALTCDLEFHGDENLFASSLTCS